MTSLAGAIFIAAVVVQLVTSHPPNLPHYDGFRTMGGQICVGGKARLLTRSYLNDYQYDECCRACQSSYSCAGFALRPADGVCYAITSGCNLRDDSDWIFYRKIGSGSLRIEAPTDAPPQIYIHSTTTTTTTSAPQVYPQLISYPEFSYVTSHCQGTPLGGREFRSTEECRKFCLATPDCFGFSLRYDGLCIAKTSNCRWLSDGQWCFYLRTFRAVVVQAPLPPTTTTTVAPRPPLLPVPAPRSLVVVQYIPVDSRDMPAWARGWPTFRDFYLMNGHCQGASLMDDYLFKAESCRQACLHDSRCIGFSMRSDGLCLPKSRACKWTNVEIDEWKFYKLHHATPYLNVVEPSEVPENPCQNPCN